MSSTSASPQRRNGVLWTTVGVAAFLVAGITGWWFTSIPDEAADRMELVSSTWSNDGSPALTVVTRLRRSDGRRVYLYGMLSAGGGLSHHKVITTPDLAHRSATITTEIRYTHLPQQPVVLECWAPQPRTNRGMQVLARWEWELLHRAPRWLPPPDLVRLPDITVAGPKVASAEK